MQFQLKAIGRFFPDKEIMTTGLKDEADIHTDNFAASAHKAKHLTIFNDFFLEDLDSTNGTYVIGQPIAKRPLKNGDVIVISKLELSYPNESNSASDAVSDKLFSAASACIVCSDSHSCSGQIAAGLPPKSLLAKTST